MFLISLDADYNEQAEIITMNGTTPVAVTLDLLRVQFLQVFTVGNTKSNVGNIDILNGADNLGRILPTEGRLRQVVGTVPAGKTWFTGKILPSCGKDDEVALHLFAFTVDGVGAMYTKIFLYQNNNTYQNFSRIAFGEKFDIESLAVKTGAAGTARISLVQEFIEVNNVNY